jgi:hypothetical protein
MRHQLLEKLARYIHARTKQISRQLPGRLWRIYGPEFATEPYLPPRLFDEYVVRYTEPMVRMIKDNGSFVLMPTACPIGRKIDARAMQNYETIVRVLENS